MFDSLSDRIQRVFKELRGEGHLTEFHVDQALKEIRTALLEADVHLDVVKEFTGTVREKAVGQEVLTALSPAQQVLKVVQAELTSLLGGAAQPLNLKRRPTVVLLVGLQGSGKTTTAAKLALHLKRNLNKQVLLVPADTFRPAATEQLRTLAKENALMCFDPKTETKALNRVRAAVKDARLFGYDVAIVDTAGRMHVDDELMDEVAEIKSLADPDEILFVADSMTGQDAVNSAKAFSNRLPLTGVILTKTDGDARGGAALSLARVVGKPVKFIGVGEKVKDLEVFHPDRAASRILGLGDVLTLIEKVSQETDRKQALQMAEKLRKNEFTLLDLRDQMRQMRKLGSFSSLLGHLPKVGPLKELSNIDIPEDATKRLEAMIDSMTPAEREDPRIIDGSRKKRIALGSGTTVPEINQLLRQFGTMKKMMKGAPRMRF
ncbi:MAG: signal recognition particle protein [Acidobacteria bacterium]|nr:signal recognition particle protein [Acidobacteriota bacterium]MCK6683000.1 signal recognition particle protein [Thermoanaerobaculia bacterium]